MYSWTYDQWEYEQLPKKHSKPKAQFISMSKKNYGKITE